MSTTVKGFDTVGSPIPIKSKSHKLKFTATIKTIAIITCSIFIPHIHFGVLVFKCVARHPQRALPSRKHFGRAHVDLKIALSLETSSKNIVFSL